MALKGQTCVSCAGGCCRHMRFQLSDDFGEEFKKSIRQNGIMDIPYRELELMGITEIGFGEHFCGQKTVDGCAEQDNKRILCKSYYCGGKYWEPKGSIKITYEWRAERPMDLQWKRWYLFSLYWLAMLGYWLEKPYSRARNK